MSLKIEKQGRTKSGITALIDGDVIVYACGFSSQHNIHTVTVIGEEEPRASFQYKKEMKEWMEKEELSEEDVNIDTRIEAEPVENALHSVKLFINDILDKTNAQYYKGFLTGKGNFRDDVATILPYKGNRDNLHKPVHYDAIRQYLIDVWDAVVVEGMEADDMLAVEQEKDWYRHDGYYIMDMMEEFKLACKTVICSIDKDLKQVPGWHYNWNKDEKPVWVSEEEGLYNFYIQLLTGDMTDNIQGIPGIGKKKAEKILEGCETEEEMFEAVQEEYCILAESLGSDGEHLYEDTMNLLGENAHLLWMIRELDENNQPIHWRAPV